MVFYSLVLPLFPTTVAYALGGVYAVIASAAVGCGGATSWIDPADESVKARARGLNWRGKETSPSQANPFGETG